ncbi:two-component system response regulator [Mucilaginibacter sp. AW1-7]|jgi:DNA-binding response OmpR family regulator|uniref:response regulator n=1 Tax=unclassified Mucilaginibacter TaxID=2617802 RepID=UPI0023655BA8|nr:response regulator [Mucilaginibacter sp. KACC 22773]WDF76321.1 response regulator [Mucilaginibacter sp. KACC 22773]
MSKKILILDDSEDILEVMKDVLEMEGYEIEILNYTADICKSVITFNADLVILDYILFGINGGELCHMLKTNPLTAHIPVVMVSAYPRVLESLGSYGSDAFVAKPFSLADIVSTVKACLLKAGDIEHSLN